MSFYNSENYIYIEIIYKPNEKNEDKVRIFGENFINNNKQKCSIIYNEKEYQLKEYFEEIDDSYNHKDQIILKLKIISQIMDISYMFYECNTLFSFSDILFFNNDNSKDTISESNTLDIMNINNNSDNFDIYHQNDTSFLSQKISTISKKSNTNFTDYIYLDDNLLPSKIISNINNMNSMFYRCNSLKSLPDISNWNTENVQYMSNLFYECKSLISLPDISKWNTENVVDMSNLFYECKSLVSLPDISKWNTVNVKAMDNMFYECNS